MTANQLITAMIDYEMDPGHAPDLRSIVRDQRMALQVAMSRTEPPGWPRNLRRGAEWDAERDAQLREHRRAVLDDAQRTYDLYVA